ncbi:MAG: hypothetical protein ACP5FL_01245 [Thermoplasmatota archaeon]
MKRTPVIVIGLALVMVALLLPLQHAAPLSSALGDNTPPNPPEITGPSQGEIWETYTYQFTITDPDGDRMERLEIYFGDDKEEILNCGCTQPYWASGTTINVTHRWTQRGDYTIQARVRDVLGEFSDWGTMQVSMPKAKTLSSEAQISVSTPVQAAAAMDDTTPPEVTIVNPREGYLHFGGESLIALPAPLPTMLPGSFLFNTGKAMVTDNVDVREEIEVTVYLDGEQRATAQYSPCSRYYEWGLLGRGIGSMTLRVEARDSSGNVGSAEMPVWYFCLLPQ